jgi:hypothetical protein
VCTLFPSDDGSSPISRARTTAIVVDARVSSVISVVITIVVIVVIVTKRPPAHRPRVTRAPTPLPRASSIERAAPSTPTAH